MDINEFKRFIVLLTLFDVYKAKNEPIRQIWNEIDGRPNFPLTMNLRRSESILRNLRFDQRENRDQGDKVAPIREVFEMFRHRLSKTFIPCESLAVDEQFVNF